MKIILGIVVAMFATQSLVGQSASWKVDPLQYNSVLEAGGLAIGQEVRIACRLELIKADYF